MKRVENTGANLNHGQKTELLRRWFTESEKSKEANSEKYHWEEDQPVAEWLDDQLKVSFFTSKFHYSSVPNRRRATFIGFRSIFHRLRTYLGAYVYQFLANLF